MKFCVRLLSLAAVICLSLQARADLVGDTINSSLYNGASTSNIEAALGSTTVPGSIDNFGFTTTITGNTITVAEDGGSTICTPSMQGISAASCLRMRPRTPDTPPLRWMAPPRPTS